MKLTKKLEKEILTVYNRMWLAYMKGDIKTFASCLHEKFQLIGTTEGEVFHNKKAVVKYFKDTADQITNVIQMRNRDLHMSPIDNNVMINEYFDLFVLIGKKWNFYGNARVTTLFTNENGKWLNLHQHGSFPDTRAGEGEQLSTEKIKKENLQLRDAVKRRTIELEDKNRELEIETSLETVRAVAMGMKKREDMLQICKSISRQLEKLGVPDIRNVQTAIFYGDKQIYFNYEYYLRHDKTIITEVDYTTHKVAKEFANRLQSGKNKVWKHGFKGKEVKKWVEYQKTTNVFIDTYLYKATSLDYYWYSLGPVAMGMSSYSPLSEEHLDLFKKFRRVFELAYRRYLDIEKAEAQAREAKIEAALERVRSRSMGMQKSEELKEVIRLVYDQLVHLGIKVDHAGFVVDYKPKGDWHFWIADKQEIPSKITHPYFDSVWAGQFNKAKEKGSDFFATFLNFEEKNKFYKDLFRHIPGLSKKSKKFYFDCPGLAASNVLMENVALYIENFSAIPYTDEENRILMRFGKAFQQTYTRFLDLQKAEAQAKEAQIELALERVRARAMSMQEPAEFVDVIHVIGEQFLRLDFDIEWANFGANGLDVAEGIDTWNFAVIPGGDPVSNRLYIPRFDHRLFIDGIRQLDNYRKTGKDFFTMTYGKKDKDRWLDHLFTKTIFKDVPKEYRAIQYAKPGYTTSTLALKDTFLSIGKFDMQSFSDEQNAILRRFGNAFGQAYTRFLDLQKAEAQARESRIQLSLERVRARTMAMHKSDELADVVGLLHKQFEELGFGLYQILISIINTEKKWIEWWSRGFGSNEPPRRYIIPFTNHSFPKMQLQKWESGETYHAHILEGKIKKSWDKYLFTKTDLKDFPEAVKKQMQSIQRVYLSDAFMKYGVLQAAGPEPLPPEKADILIRFAKVLDQAYTRMMDLQKAETQAREAQIEAALEKVRSRSLAMHKSEELNEVVLTLLEQIMTLHIDIDSININILNDTSTGLDSWFTAPGYSKAICLYTPYFDNPVMNDIFNAIKNKKDLLSKVYSKKEKNDYFNYLYKHTDYKNLAEERKKWILAAKTWSFSVGITDILGISINSYSGKIFSDEDHKILLRFTKVFNQSYQRFLDLQKAEAQAREAQIEAGLERVRSRSMAMHQTSELQEVIHTVHKELLSLNLSIFGGSFVVINNDVGPELRCWGAGGTANTSEEVVVPDFNMPFCTNLVKGIKSGPGFFTEEFSQKDKKKYFTKLFTQKPWSDLGDEQKKETLSSPGGYTRSVAVSKHTSIFIINHNGKKFTEAENDILKRFANVFEQTYTRFLDLLRAEAQAREARIEAALEKVRAVAMSMHISDDLLNVCEVLFHELRQLGFTNIRNTIIDIYDDDKKGKLNYDYSDVMGKTISFVPYDIHPFIEKQIREIRSGEDAFSETVFTGQELEAWKEFRRKSGQQDDPRVTSSSTLHYYFFSIRKGSIGISTFGNIDANQLELLKRFRNVFGLSYQRYMDIVLAEAQARNAQIEVAVERVRAKALAMHKPEDLHDAVVTLKKELMGLQIPEITAATIYLSQNDGLIRVLDLSDTAEENDNMPQLKLDKVFRLEDTDPKLWIRRMWGRNESYFVLEADEEDFERAIQWIKTVDPDGAEIAEKIIREKSIKKAWLPTVKLEKGVMNIDLLAPPAPEVEKILLKMGAGFDLAYKRFLDLQKAQTQAREAQIEAALERVRSRSMGMQHSDELAEVATMLFQQVKALGVSQWTCGFSIFEIDDKEFTWYPGGPGGEILAPCKIPLTEHPVFISFNESRKRGDDLYIYEKTGEVQADHYRYMLTLPVVGEYLQSRLDAGEQFPDFQIDHLANFSHGNLVFITYEHFPEMHDIFKRFAKVFDQTYTRFLDLQKAEAQAREAQIEASLERIRSRTMGMQKTDELKEVVALLYEESNKFGFESVLMILNTRREEDDGFNWWFSANEQTVLPQSYFIPDLDEPVLRDIKSIWESGKPDGYIQMGGSLKKEHDRRLFSETGLRDLPDHLKEMMRSYESVFISIANMKNGFIEVAANEFISRDRANILQRYAKVFEQTYTRFLDLQKAELQAREAEIELGLERVRARTMAMQKSDELKEVVQTLSTEIGKLDVIFTRTFIVIYEPDTLASTWWMSNPETNESFGLFVKYHEHVPYQAHLDAWRERKKDWQYILEGDDKKQWDHFLFHETDLSELPERVKNDMQEKEKVCLSCSFSNFGYLVLESPEPISSDQFDILYRFARVFDLTYTRFQDIQRAEAQAIRAEKDLVEIKAARKRAEETLVELQSTQKQLIQSEKMASLGELTAGIAHEIQNPLNFVNNFSDVSNELIEEMKEELSKGNIENVAAIVEDVRQNLEKINHHGKRADGIVKGMLQHSRISSGQKELTDINVLCDEYLRLAYHGLRAKDKTFNAEIKTEFDNNIGKIDIVPQDIGRVVLNLINNAFYAVNERKKLLADSYQPLVEVKTRRIHNKVEISVKDNGNGIPESIKEKIFQPFFTTKPTGQGTGLGLSLSYDIIKAHGGELMVGSKQGEGAEFKIILPGNIN